MRFRYATLLAAPLLALAVAAPAQAQGRLTVTPLIGGYIPGNDIQEIADGAEQVSIDKEATLGLGLNVELGWLRGSVAYASGAKITADSSGTPGVEGEIGEGSVLAAAADLVLRPIPRLIIVQPYLLGGVGLKRTDYEWESEGVADAFPEDQSDFTLHVGVGADVMLGPVGLVVEVTDFISKQGDDDFGRHDAFGMLGVKFALF
ncbi:MAG: outer membrane beta-barrel protein [Longimicrobiales bacterium]